MKNKTSENHQPISWHFKQLDESDLPLLLTWFKNPHVADWWPTPEPDELLKKFLERIRSKDTLGFIVYLDETPLGYIQYYHLDPENPKAGDLWIKDLPQTTIGTDQFIGEPEYIGKGY